MTKFAALPSDKQAELNDHLEAIARLLSRPDAQSLPLATDALWTECCGFRIFYSVLRSEGVIAVVDIVDRPLPRP